MRESCGSLYQEKKERVTTYSLARGWFIVLLSLSSLYVESKSKACQTNIYFWFHQLAARKTSIPRLDDFLPSSVIDQKDGDDIRMELAVKTTCTLHPWHHTFCNTDDGVVMLMRN